MTDVTLTEAEREELFAWCGEQGVAAVERILAARSQRPEGVTVTGASLIAAERRRQVEVKGYTAEHDGEHGPGQLARAANCYRRGDRTGWPWWPEAWKPKDHLSNLIRSGALYLAALAIADSDKTHGSVNEIPHYLRQGLNEVTSEIDATLAKAAEVSGDTEAGDPP